MLLLLDDFYLFYFFCLFFNLFFIFYLLTLSFFPYKSFLSQVLTNNLLHCCLPVNSLLFLKMLKLKSLKINGICKFILSCLIIFTVYKIILIIWCIFYYCLQVNSFYLLKMLKLESL